MVEIATPRLPAAELERLAARFPERTIALGGDRRVSVRECGTGHGAELPLVCLHGIGSGAASWMETAVLLAQHTRVIAWDAPGYGESTALTMDAPRGVDYAERLHALLNALDIQRCVLVGHSLGALMAAPAVRLDGEGGRFAALVLISPAQGYGAEGREADRERVHAERLNTLARLGIAGMAAQRSTRLVSEHASPVARAWVQWNMARLHERGLRQAIELLCGGDLVVDLPPTIPVQVACGELDVVTSPNACAEVARRCNVDLQLIKSAGHASYVEQPAAVAQLLGRVLSAVQG
ncbi:MAG: Hydrolase, alpha/beta fold family [Burkholderiaceae bacterium]|jgi:pimeloyl-ACP methyl ester carboxylesterase|nr:MAG: Hydrolase, alpha/beta fold family [Burkholderiaceae bacterium]